MNALVKSTIKIIEFFDTQSYNNTKIKLSPNSSVFERGKYLFKEKCYSLQNEIISSEIYSFSKNGHTVGTKDII